MTPQAGMYGEGRSFRRLVISFSPSTSPILMKFCQFCQR
jgi:hypothetical protein